MWIVGSSRRCGSGEVLESNPNWRDAAAASGRVTESNARRSSEIGAHKSGVCTGGGLWGCVGLPLVDSLTDGSVHTKKKKKNISIIWIICMSRSSDGWDFLGSGFSVNRESYFCPAESGMERECGSLGSRRLSGNM